MHANNLPVIQVQQLLTDLWTTSPNNTIVSLTSTSLSSNDYIIKHNKQINIEWQIYRIVTNVWTSKPINSNTIYPNSIEHFDFWFVTDPNEAVIQVIYMYPLKQSSCH